MNDHEHRFIELELQMKRLVSDAISEKRNYADIHSKMWNDIDSVKDTVFGGINNIGLKARLEIAEDVIKEMRTVVRRLERSAWLMLGGFAAVKFLFDVLLKH